MTSRLVRRSRSIVAALAAIAVSAGVVAAARPASMPAAATDGLDRAAAAAGQTVPVTPTVVPAAGGDTDRILPDADDAPSANADPAEHPDNHGAAVSEAASGDTPGGFDNHGQYVRSVATDNHGQDTAADAVAKHAVEHASDHAKGGPAAP